MRILTPKIFPVAVEADPGEKMIWLKGDNNALDSSGNVRHATWLVSENYDTGLSGQCFEIASAGSYGLNTSGSPTLDLDPDGSFTVELDVKLDAVITYPDPNAIFLLMSRCPDWQWNFAIILGAQSDSPRISVSFITATESQAVLPSDGYLDDTDWHHIKLVYSNGNWKLYLDTVLVLGETPAEKFFSDPSYLSIGLAVGAAHTIRLDEIMIYE